MGFVDSIRVPRTIGSVIDSHIRQMVQTPSNAIKTVLLLGGDNGSGLAKTLYMLAMRAFQPAFTVQPLRVFVNEHSPDKYTSLSQLYGGNPLISIYNYFPATDVLTATEVRTFYSSTQTRRKLISVSEAVRGAAEETALLAELDDDGISEIKDDASLSFFDLAIVDGAWFTGDNQFSELRTSKFILLFDHNTIKNAPLYDELIDDGFTRIAINKTTAMDDDFNFGAGVALLRRSDAVTKQLRPDGTKKLRTDDTFKLRP